MDESLEGARVQLEVTQDILVNAIEELGMLKEELRAVGMHGTVGRIEAYSEPHLQSWVTDQDQMGSLASIRDEIEDQASINQGELDA